MNCWPIWPSCKPTKSEHYCPAVCAAAAIALDAAQAPPLPPLGFLPCHSLPVVLLPARRSPLAFSQRQRNNRAEQDWVGAHLSAQISSVIAFARVAEDGPGVATSIRVPIALRSPAAAESTPYVHPCSAFARVVGRSPALPDRAAISVAREHSGNWPPSRVRRLKRIGPMKWSGERPT